ncbi:LOW QUALITY PROTEIN: olfactory receptor 1500-like, partial [Spinachia spinachia]
LGSSFLLLIIYLVRTLHTPKYMIVFNLAFTDLCGSTALIPKLLDTLMFDRRYLAYEACLSQMFPILFFVSIQSWTLVTMAYNRSYNGFIAICFPLRYHSIVTKPSIAAMLLLLVFIVRSIDLLSFCRPLVATSLYCDYAPVFLTACNDISFSYIMAYVAFVLVLCIPLIIIALTYVCISVVRINNTTKR